MQEESPSEMTFQPAPDIFRRILDAPLPPSVWISPSRKHGLLYRGERYLHIADLAQPVLRLAGFRLNPKTNGPRVHPHIIELSIIDLPHGGVRSLQIPHGSQIGSLVWSPTGHTLAFLQTTQDSIQLGLCNTDNGEFVVFPGLRINAAFGDPYQWMPDGRTLLCQIIPSDRGHPPRQPTVPSGPRVMESAGKRSPVRTYQDLLKDSHDEELLEYYCTSQLVLVDTETKAVTPVGQPGLIRDVVPSPDGQYLLVVRNCRPYSYLFPASRFPKTVEVWDLDGNVVYTLANLPLAEEIPIEGVATGPRHPHWIPGKKGSSPTLVWVEALDGGDPSREAEHRDRLLRFSAPFSGSLGSGNSSHDGCTITDTPEEWFRTNHRLSGLTWGENGLAFIREYDRDKRWKRTFVVDSQDPNRTSTIIWDMSVHEKYRSPGGLVMRRLENGDRVVWQHENTVYLIGDGATPDGDRPFLDAMDLDTCETRRLFQCEPGVFERPIALLRDDASEFLTRRESLTEPPNIMRRRTGQESLVALTGYVDPAPELRHIRKEIITYQRDDGVELSCRIYYPPDYETGQRRPGVVWAYPKEYADEEVAGQISGSSHRFTIFGGASHLFFLLAGYIVLHDAKMPVVGDPETANDSFLTQIVSSAKAVIDKSDEMGILDRNRVGVGGHSYGAFMTAHLLANCDLFRAGIACSGAYNRTLTPFGFQQERRTLWEAPGIYQNLSPFMKADKIDKPLLLIHGEEDNNPGTFSMQSERMYHALKGHGGIVRLVMLPHESHGYRARESIEHVLWEMLTWFDRYVKS